MWRGSIVGLSGNPQRWITGRVKGSSDNRPRDLELIRARNEAGVAQPDDVFVVVIEFRTVVTMRADCVRPGMSVDDRCRVIGVGLVHMLLRHRRSEDKPRRQGKADDRTRKPR